MANKQILIIKTTRSCNVIFKGDITFEMQVRLSANKYVKDLSGHEHKESLKEPRLDLQGH